jgi:hypothetical protein
MTRASVNPTSSHTFPKAIRTSVDALAVAWIFTALLMFPSVARAGESLTQPGDSIQVGRDSGAVGQQLHERVPGPWTCLDRLENKVHVGSMIRVITTRDTIIRGTYLGLGSDRSTVRLGATGSAASPVEVRIQEIRGLKYRTHGHAQMKYGLYGLVVGAAGGALVGSIVGGRSGSSGGPADFSIAFNVGSGAFFGGLGGLLLGPFVPIFVRHDHAILCPGAPAEGSKMPTSVAPYVVTMSGGERVGATEVRIRSGMLMLLLSDGTSRYVNPAKVKLVMDKYGEDHTDAVLDEKQDLK